MRSLQHIRLLLLIFREAQFLDAFNWPTNTVSLHLRNFTIGAAAYYKNIPY